MNKIKHSKSAMELQLMISAFKALDLAKLTPEQIMKRIEKILHQYQEIPMDLNFNGELYRARINQDKKDFLHKNELWYRTKKIEEIKIGRFNKNAESLFYAALELNTAVFELKPKIGDVITVMQLMPITEIGKFSVILTGLGQSKSDKISKNFKEEIFSNDPLINRQKWLRTDKFLEEILTENVEEHECYKYHATNAVAELLFKIPSIDGLYYPSMATSLKGLNLCLKPESADKVLMPSKFFMIEVVDIIHDTKEGKFYGCKNIKTAKEIRDNGEILW